MTGKQIERHLMTEARIWMEDYIQDIYDYGYIQTYAPNVCSAKALKRDFAEWLRHSVEEVLEDE